MKKKLISTVLSAAMICSMITVPAAHAENSGVLQLTADNTSVSAGSQVVFTVSLNDISDASGVQASVSYPEDVLEYADYDLITDTALSVNSISGENGKVNIALSTAPSYMSGDIVAIKFNVLDTAEPGVYNIDIANPLVSVDDMLYDIEAYADEITVDNTKHADISITPSSKNIGCGEEITYEVNLNGLNDVRGISSEFTYDVSAFDFVSAEAGSAVKDNITNFDIKNDGSGSIKLIESYNGSMSLDGSILSITLRSKDDCPSGTIKPISIKAFDVSNALDEIENITLNWVCEPVSVNFDSRVVFKAIPDKNVLKPGKEITYTVGLDSNCECSSYQTALIYDKEAFDLVSCSKSDFMQTENVFSSDFQTSEEGVVGIYCTYSSPAVVDGDIAEITLRAKEGIASASYSVEPGATMMADADANDMNIELSVQTEPVSVTDVDGSYDLTTESSRTAVWSGSEADDEKEIVAVTLALPVVEDLSTMRLSLEYDTELFEPIEESASVAGGDIYASSNFKLINYNYKPNAVGVYISFPSASKYTGGGTIATIKFKPIKGAEGNGNFNLVVDNSVPELIVPESVSVSVSETCPAQSVIDSIESIGVVYADSNPKLSDARNAYDSLDDEFKYYVEDKGLDVTLSDSEAAYGTVTKIEDIQTPVTLETESLLIDAESSYNSLTEDGRKLVGNYTKLAEARAEFDANKSAADKVDEYIELIGTVIYSPSNQTEDSLSAIERAETAYAELNETSKSMVQNYETLVEARKTYEFLMNQVTDVIDIINAIGEVTPYDETREKIEQAEKAYSLLDEKLKAQVTNYDDLIAARELYDIMAADNQAAQAVVQLIDAIGEVSLDSYDAINVAEKAYDELTMAQKSYVPKESELKLSQARAEYDKLVQDQQDLEAIVDTFDAIDKIGTVTLSSEEAIQNAREKYDALRNDDLRNQVSNYDVLEAAEARLAELKAAKAAADNVTGLINAIGEVVYTEECKALIDQAREAYDLLDTDDATGFVENYQTLVDAENKYAELKTAADNQAAADNVIGLINAIGEVTLEKETLVIDARAEYTALTDDQKKLISEEILSVLEQAEKAIEQLKQDKEAAAPVIELIEMIGEVTLESEKSISDAREAYNSLNDSQKSFVTNYSTLQEAEARFAKLSADEADRVAVENVESLIAAIGEVQYTEESKALIDSAKAAYEELTDARKAMVENISVLEAAEAKYEELKAAAEKAEADKAAAKAVDEKIAAIGEVQYTEESKALIDDARTAYDELTDDQKAIVEKLTDLEAAEAKYEELKAAAEKAEADKAAAKAVDEKIAAIGEVQYTEESKALIDDARAAYDELTDDQKALVSNYQVLVDAENTYNEMYETIKYSAIIEDTDDGIKITATKHKDDNETAVMIVAVYDANGIMTALYAEDITEKGSNEFAYRSGGKVKVMFWNSIEKMQPYTGCIMK